MAPRGRILDRKGKPLVTNRATMAVFVDPTSARGQGEQAVTNTLCSSGSRPCSRCPLPTSSSRVSSVKRARPGAAHGRASTSRMRRSPTSRSIRAEFPRCRGARAGRSASTRRARWRRTCSATRARCRRLSSTTPQTNGYQYGDIVGKAGAEAEFEKVLQGDRGQRAHRGRCAGRPRRVIQDTDPVAGHDVVLTIDSKVQEVTERALAQALRGRAQGEVPQGARAARRSPSTSRPARSSRWRACRPTTRACSWAASRRSSGQSLTAKDSEYPLTNRAIMGQYPAASTFKAMTGLGGLRDRTHHRRARPTTASGSVDRHGQAVEEVLLGPRGARRRDVHCDGIATPATPYFYQSATASTRTRARSSRSSRGRSVSVPRAASTCPARPRAACPTPRGRRATTRTTPSMQQWLPGDTVNLAIGQGDLLVTPLQLADAYAGIANGGKVMKPHVLKQVLGAGREARCSSASRRSRSTRKTSRGQPRDHEDRAGQRHRRRYRQGRVQGFPVDRRRQDRYRAGRRQGRLRVVRRLRARRATPSTPSRSSSSRAVTAVRSPVPPRARSSRRCSAEDRARHRDGRVEVTA